MLLRAVLIWMVMLAVPVQGIAASTMLLCGPGHHRQQQAGGAAVDHAAHGHADHQDHPAGGAVADRYASHAPSASVQDGATHDIGLMGIAELSNAKCSACASCGSAAAILGTVPAVAVMEQNTAAPVAPAPDFDAVVADGPERPPRSFLA